MIRRAPVAWALGLGILLGLIVDVSVNKMNYPTSTELRDLLLGPFGVVSGSVAAVTTFGLTLGFTSRRSVGGKFGLVLATVVLIVFGSGPVLFIVAFTLYPLTLEGAWIYPLGFVSYLMAAFTVGRLSPTFGWLIAATTLACFAGLIVVARGWAVRPPSLLEEAFLYFLAALSLVGAVLTGLKCMSSSQPQPLGSED